MMKDLEKAPVEIHVVDNGSTPKIELKGSQEEILLAWGWLTLAICDHSSGNAAIRLAAYENAMPLERAQELAQAEKDGRLVVMPCKVGDLLYEVDLPEYGVITCKVLHVGTYNGPAAHVEGNSMVSAVSVGVEVVEGHGKGSGYAFEAEDFGETVFLTREEAEAALKKRAEESNETD